MKEKKKNLFAEILGSVTKYFLVLVAIVILIISLSGLRIVKSGNVALILRFGKLVGNTYDEQVHGPGLLFAFPYIIDEVVIVPTGSVIEQTVTTHYTNGAMSTLRNNGYVITGDSNIAIISASVKYAVTDPVKYALGVKNVSATVDAFVSSSMTEKAASVAVDDLLTSGKDQYTSDIMKLSQKKLDAAGVGITLTAIELTTVSMPYEVKETYDLVNSTAVNAKTQIEQANQYRENLIPKAQADAQTLINAARSEQSDSISAANAYFAEFNGLLAEYDANPDVVTIRLYNEKMKAAIGKIGKVRIVGDGETKIILGD